MATTTTAGSATDHRAELRAFLADALPAHQAEWGDSRSFPARLAWQRRLAPDGWAAMSWPVEYGGRGMSIVDRLACETELALSGAPPLAGLLGLANVGPTLITFGDEEQRSHLPAILDGREIWCQGFSEPDAGSDLAGLRTTAMVTDNGFVVNGRKIWTTNGMEATHCMLLARTDRELPKHAGISAFVLPLDLPGIERHPIRQMDGGQEFAEMVFDDVELPRSALLGPLNDGWRVTMTTLSHERAGVISQAALLERDVLAEIHRMGGTVSAVLRQEISQRYVEGRVLGLLGARALAELAAGGSPGPQHSMIRLAQSQLRQRLAETRARAHGVAVVAGGEPAVATELLSSRSATIAAGTKEILKNVLAERVLGLPKG